MLSAITEQAGNRVARLSPGPHGALGMGWSRLGGTCSSDDRVGSAVLSRVAPHEVRLYHPRRHPHASASARFLLPHALSASSSARFIDRRSSVARGLVRRPAGVTLLNYRRMLLEPMNQYSDIWRNSDLRVVAVDDNAFDVAETEIYKAAADAVRNPTTVRHGTLREMVEPPGPATPARRSSAACLRECPHPLHRASAFAGSTSAALLAPAGRLTNGRKSYLGVAHGPVDAGTLVALGTSPYRCDRRASLLSHPAEKGYACMG